jgi:WD40 repeat protein
MGLDLSRDGRWLALGDSSGNVQVWDFRTRRLVAERVLRTVPPARVIACGFSPHGKMLGCAAFPSEGGTALLKLWRTDGWAEINTDHINFINVLEADISQDERTLAVSYQDGSVIWWEIATGKPQKSFDARHAGPLIAFSPDGRLFGGVQWSGGITLWNAATREYKFFDHGFRSFAYDLAFSPDSRRVLAVGSTARELVKFWDVATGREIATLPGEEGAFTRLRFSPDGTALILVSWEGKGLLWRVPSFEEIEAKQKGQENQ